MRAVSYLYYFSGRVLKMGSALAARSQAGELSYAELNARSNRLAHYLKKLGVGREVLVAIALERSLDLLVALLAVWKAEGAYVPLDPDFPGERLASILSDARAAEISCAVFRPRAEDPLPG